MMGMRDFWVLMGYLLMALRRALTVAWIRLNKFISCSDWQVRSSTDFRHKVVLIGDGFAEGLGDWVVMGGMAGVTRQLQMHAGTDDKVRMQWEIINRGRSGSTSADWLPYDETSLYRKKVHSRACEDAEIFVVCLGTMDIVGECVGMPVAALRKTALDEFTEEETCDTVKNIREICEALRAEGKKVIVCNVMTSGAGINRRAGLAKRLNRQLSLYVRQAEAKADAANDPVSSEPVRLAKLNNPRSSRDDGRAFDGLHLNAKGYKSFAADLYDVLGPMMVAVEWKIWKRHLAGGNSAGGGGAAVAPVSGESIKPKSKASKKAD